MPTPARGRVPAALRGLLLVAVLVLCASGCNWSSESRSCSWTWTTCHYTITTHGLGLFESSDFSGGPDGGAHAPSFEFTVVSLAPGRAEIDADPGDTTAPTTMVVGGTVRIDDDIALRLESSDGQSATLTF